ncbi:MAG: hypothetical protein B6242_16015 [Anaerolineaceae bacterium 4572_78]|nr:MAG: hypothetical protein B6242_16015 [Anaerolineaceae bacterium 4572_78]
MIARMDSGVENFRYPARAIKYNRLMQWIKHATKTIPSLKSHQIINIALVPLVSFHKKSPKSNDLRLLVDLAKGCFEVLPFLSVSGG